MTTPITIATYDEIKAERPDTRCAPTNHALTAAALVETAALFADRAPEAGAMVFGDPNKALTDTVRFDAQGSGRATSTTYSPDRATCEAETRRFLQLDPPDQRVSEGFVHLHPAGCRFPSGILGHAEGDVAYALAWLTANEAPQQCFMHVITQEQDGLRLIPWVVSRYAPCQAWYQPLVLVDDPNEAGPRQYNPIWEARVAAKPEPSYPRDADGYPVIRVDLDEVAAATRSKLRLDVNSATFTRPDLEVRLTWTKPLVALGPEVVVAQPGLPDRVLSYRWHERHRHRLELRLIKLVNYSFFLTTIERLLGRFSHRLGRRF